MIILKDKANSDDSYWSFFRMMDKTAQALIFNEDIHHSPNPYLCFSGFAEVEGVAEGI